VLGKQQVCKLEINAHKSNRRFNLVSIGTLPSLDDEQLSKKKFFVFSLVHDCGLWNEIISIKVKFSLRDEFWKLHKTRR
jgi:hypothetical protein